MVKIFPFLLEKLFLNFLNELPVSQYHYYLSFEWVWSFIWSPLGKGCGPSFEQTWIPFTQGCFCQVWLKLVQWFWRRKQMDRRSSKSMKWQKQIFYVQISSFFLNSILCCRDLLNGVFIVTEFDALKCSILLHFCLW